MLGLIPEPSAEFSPLAITKSIDSRWRSAGSDSVTILTPGLPTMSPINRIRTPCSWPEVNSLRRQLANAGRSMTQAAYRRALPSGCGHGLPRNVGKPRLADYRHLDLARIRKLFLERLGNVAANLGRFR